MKTGPLNQALKDIVLLDNEKATLTGGRVVAFETTRQLRTLRDRRKSLVAAIQNARRPR